MKKLSLTLFIFVYITNIFAQDRGIRPFVKERAEGKKHIALIIGNSNYPNMPLKNPINDANAVAKVFNEMGFVVENVTDANREQMLIAIKKFSIKMQTANVAVFYFAGHGMQIDGENYLIPIGKTEGTQITKQEQVPYRAINAGEILAAMETNKVKLSLMVLDACRNNPIKGSNRGKLKGLASMDTPVGSLVMYATKAGEVAIDGVNQNSPFTTAFLQHISTPGLDVNLLPLKVTKTVHELTDGKQTPGTYVQITQSFCLVPELTADEIKKLKKHKQNKLTELQIKQAEQNRQQDKENAELARQKAELKILDNKIKYLKKQTKTDNSKLDKMIEIMEQRKEQKAKLDALQKEIVKDQKRRKKEIYDMKQIKFNETIIKYNKIAKSELMQDMKLEAWNSVLEELSIEKGSIEIDDINSLKYKFYDMPRQIIDERDGKTYNTVWIGKQVWFKQNLAFKTDSGCWAYDNDEKNVAEYGYLYSWEASKNVCPIGWHLPSKSEFEILLNNYGGKNDDKANYTALIKNNKNDFSASYAGWCDETNNYDRNNEGGFFWTSSEKNNKNAWRLYIGINNKKAYIHYDNQKYGFSIRCIKD